MASSPLRIAILGPTASGKSSVAVAAAKHLDLSVVNGDPFQSLAGIPIGTGQPSREEQGGVPHLGYGVLPLSYRPNPADFGIRVRQWLSESQGAVLVTGSGLFLRGIWEQLDALPEPDPELVAKGRRWVERLGAPALHRYLAAVDPVRSRQLHPNDGSRIQRALSLHLATGLPPSRLLTGVRRGLPQGWRGLLVLPTREHLLDRVARRVKAMTAAGWAEEVCRVVVQGDEAALRELRPLGYENWLSGGEVELVVAAITSATQAYAKRQVTFFRNQWPELPTWDPDAESLETALAKLGL